MAGHVLQVVTDTDRRGAQVFASDLHEALRERGRAVRTVALEGRRHMGGLDVPTLGSTRLGATTLRALRSEICRAGVVVGHGSSTLAACAVGGAGTGVPFVYRQVSDQLFWAGTPARRLRVQAYLRRADAVVALWAGAAHVLAERFGVPAGRIRLIPNAVPAERFPVPSTDERAAARTRFPLGSDAPVILSIGALVPEKGVDLAVRAVSDLDAHLLVVGDGPERSRLQQLAGDLAPRKVHFAGSVTDPRQAYAAADVVVLASRGGDSMPAVLIEAGLSQLPAVATPIGGIGEIVLPGRTGELVEPDDVAALRQALGNVAASSGAYGRAARQRCLASFEIDVVAAAWDRLLASL